MQLDMDCGRGSSRLYKCHNHADIQEEGTTNWLQLSQRHIPTIYCWKKFSKSNSETSYMFCWWRNPPRKPMLLPIRSQKRSAKSNTSTSMWLPSTSRNLLTKSTEKPIGTILSKQWCPNIFLGIIRQLHEGAMARVYVGGDLSDPFAVNNDVKQGCVLASVLFIIFIAASLKIATNELRTGIGITFVPLSNSSTSTVWKLLPKSNLKWSSNCFMQMTVCS